MQVRAIRGDEWVRWRGMRLRALAADPRAFGRTLEEESAFPDAWWMQRAPEAPGRANLVVEEDDEWLALCGLGEKDGEPEVWGMWVAPEARGRGAGALLLRECAARTAERGHRSLTLWVNVENAPASALYRREGFVDDGPPWRGTRDPTRTFQKMRKAV